MARTTRAILQLMVLAMTVAAPALFAADLKVHVDDTTVARGEKAGAAAFVARLDQPVPQGAVLTLDWETVDGTAVAKTDFVPGKGSVKVTSTDPKVKVVAVVPLMTGKDAAARCAFSIKVKASITGAHTVTVDNAEGKATATIFKDTTRVAPRAN